MAVAYTVSGIAWGSPLAQGLVAAWPIDDRVGGVVRDATGRGNNGSVPIPETWVVSGAGDGDYNGTYVSNGTQGGETAYRISIITGYGTKWLYYAEMEMQWALSTNKGDDVWMESAYSNGETLPGSWWVENGDAPAPSVAAGGDAVVAGWADSHLEIADRSDGYVTVPNDASIQNTDCLSVGLWIYLEDAIGNNTRYIFTKQNPAHSESEFFIRWHAATQQIRCGFNANNNYVTGFAPPAGDYPGWHYMCATYQREGADTRVRFYWDGVEEMSGLKSGELITPVATDITIGGGDTNTTLTPECYIRDAALWNRALSPQEVQSLAVPWVLYRQPSPVLWGLQSADGGGTVWKHTSGGDVVVEGGQTVVCQYVVAAGGDVVVDGGQTIGGTVWKHTAGGDVVVEGGQTIACQYAVAAGGDVVVDGGQTIACQYVVAAGGDVVVDGATSHNILHRGGAVTTSEWDWVRARRVV
jgi:hypothetical protein